MALTQMQKEAMHKYRASWKYRSPEALERRRRRNLKWYHRNKERVSAQTSARYHRDRDQRRAEAARDYATNPLKYRHWQLWTCYRLTPERFQELLGKQNGKCPCGYVFVVDVNNRNRSVKPHVDHDHRCCKGVRSCGKCVRGLLCNRCNRAIGLLKDSPELLRTLAAWVEVKPSQE